MKMGDFWLLGTNVANKFQIKTDGLQILHMKIISSFNESLFLCILMMGAIAHKFEFWVVYICMI